ncbi:hypothetical protein [Actinacidiphila acidipaludis]|uniref:Glycosyl transferase family 2 n=1 Tax=Actinacidiphila acidipaludis TaxID=2873382 RepID=A0ABS7QE49_9ACTN|nr:hypothetical protein [Streptomyces acidipaludis]MBY8881443.1 hypothetical protein [Streptomyces acidipaludis]
MTTSPATANLGPQAAPDRVGVAERAIALNIMCHPSRLPMAEELAADLGPAVRIVLDPEPDAPADAVRCAAEAWAASGPEHSHVLVLQDDMTLTPDFTRRLVNAVTTHPGDVIALFAAWSSATSGAARLAALNGYSWLSWRADYVPGPALVMPATLAREFSAFLRAAEDRSTGDAGLLQSFLSARGRRSLLTVPSLAQHDVRGADSVLGNGVTKGVRRSVCFAGDLAEEPDAGRPEADAAVFEAPESPFVSQQDFTAYVNVKDRSPQDLVGTDVPAERWLAGRGADAGLLGEAWVAARQALPAELGGLVRAERLYQTWLSAVCLGVLSLGAPAGAGLSAAGEAALATTVPGVYRRVFTDAVLEQLAAASLPMLKAGYDAGRKMAG